MSGVEKQTARSVEASSGTNGPAAAALLACGIGCSLLGVLAVAGDASKRIASLLNFYNPTGPLGGATTVAIAAWLIGWALLTVRWRTKQVAFGKVSTAAYVLLALGLLLTFPPFRDLLLGRLATIIFSTNH